MSLFDSEPASMAFISQHHFLFSFYTSTTVQVQSTRVDGEKQEGVDILGSLIGGLVSSVADNAFSEGGVMLRA